MVKYSRLEHLHKLPGMTAHVWIPLFQGFNLSFLFGGFKWVTEIKLIPPQCSKQQISAWIIWVFDLNQMSNRQKQLWW